MTKRVGQESRFGPDGRYRLLRVIGEDQIGTVWTAEDTSWHRTVTLRVVSRSLGSDERFTNRFASALEQLLHPVVSGGMLRARISHANAARTLGFDLGDETSPPYVVMEEVSGPSLAEVLKREGNLQRDMAVRFTLAVAEAVQAAHEVGVVHGGVNPANVLLDLVGGVKVIDFGLWGAWASMAGLAYGDRKLSVYIAPEVLAGGNPNPLSDVFSVGGFFYTLLTGRPPAMTLSEPFERLSSLPPEVPDGLGRVCLRALAKNPYARPTSMKDFVSQIPEPAATSIAIESGGPLRESPEVPEPPQGASGSVEKVDSFLSTRRGDQVLMLTNPPSIEAGLRSVVLDRGRRRDKRPQPPLGASQMIPASASPISPASNQRRRLSFLGGRVSVRFKWRKAPRRTIVVWIAAALVFVIAGLIVSTLLFARGGATGSPHGRSTPGHFGVSGGRDSGQTSASLVAVPRVKGLTASRARQRLLKAGLNLEKVKPVLGTPGIVQRSTPQAGTYVRPGTGVTLFVGTTRERMKSSG